MITPILYNDLGRAQYGWLDARHHFSFGNYYNPNRMGFGKLRVINDDIIQAGTGFNTHPHENMEIITYVRQGAITHKDSSGNEGRTEAGDVQVMSAGTGIHHSEHNRENVDTSLYQIWIEPNEQGVKPRWDAHRFPESLQNNHLSLLVSGDGAAPLMIHADASIYAGKLTQGAVVTQGLKHQGYLLVSNGEITLGDFVLGKGDAAEITNIKNLQIKANEYTNILLIDVAP